MPAIKRKSEIGDILRFKQHLSLYVLKWQYFHDVIRKEL